MLLLVGLLFLVLMLLCSETTSITNEATSPPQETSLRRSIITNEATIKDLRSQMEDSRKRTQDIENKIRETKFKGNRAINRLHYIRRMDLFPKDADLIRRMVTYVEKLEAEIRAKEARLL